jgi:hypothetical protein
MKTLHVEHRFPVSPDKYFEIIRSKEFDDALMAHIEITKEELGKTTTANGFVEKLKLAPKRELPGFVKSVAGGLDTYVETRDWNVKDRINYWSEEPASMADRISIKGNFKWGDDGQGGTLRTVDGEFTIKMLLIGGKIEEFIVDTTRASLEKAAAFTLDWITKHPV